jgi:tetratricopeptide (TPR) repeat protein
MESKEKIDSLHQQASAHYLQGEFHQALEAWKELLALDPQDERAIEGVTLCELLAENDGGGGAVPATEPAEPAKQAEPAGPGGSVEGFDDDLDELDAILDGKAEESASDEPTPSFDLEFSDPGEQAVDQPPEPPVDGSQRQAEGIDFGDLSTEEPISLGDGAEPGEPQFAVDPHSLDLPDNDPSAEAANPGATAAAELRHRVDELMMEAHGCLEKGDTNGALSALNRIALLDEHNGEAEALRNRIEEELQQPTLPQETAAEEVQPPQLDLQIPEEPAPAPPPAIEETPPPVEEPVADAEPEEEVAEVPFEQEDQPPAPAAEAEPSVEIAVGMSKPSLRDRLSGMNLLIIVGVLAVIAIGGLSAWWFLWGPGAGGADDGSGESAIAAAGPGALPELPKLPGEEEPGEKRPAAKERSKPSEPSPEQQADLSVLIAEAEEAFDREDYREAVLAYNRVLEVDPDNQEANSRLAIAGERYRELKELEDKRAEAIEAFNRGNYRAALTIFYRMPESEDQKKLDRYKLNGWYNMGLQALSMGDCNSASTHLKEAKTIDPSDKEVIIALDLARICKYSRGDSSYRDEVEQLAPRALED